MPPATTLADAIVSDSAAEPHAPTASPRRRWWKALAAGSFLFFLIKGLIWLAVVGTAIFQIAD